MHLIYGVSVHTCQFFGEGGGGGFQEKQKMEEEISYLVFDMLGYFKNQKIIFYHIYIGRRSEIIFYMVFAYLAIYFKISGKAGCKVRASTPKDKAVPVSVCGNRGC